MIEATLQDEQRKRYPHGLLCLLTGSGSSVAETDEIISRLIEEAIETDVKDVEQPSSETAKM